MKSDAKPHAIYAPRSVREKVKEELAWMERMSKILEGLEGVVCLIDDVLVQGRNEAEHDERY